MLCIIKNWICTSVPYRIHLLYGIFLRKTMQDKFDNHRTGSGTKEWSEHSFNIQRGCPNLCHYCWARADALRFRKISTPEEWGTEVLTKNAFITSFPKKSGVIMFPTTHDVTPFYLETYTRVARLILSKGNQLLIVTKPRKGCIKSLCRDLYDYKDQILFRFTIGSWSDSVCKLGEPGAPSATERQLALIYAHDYGFRTSVSIEPMLDDSFQTTALVHAVDEYVTDTIWVGKMNKILLRVRDNSPETRRAIAQVERNQSDEQILKLYDLLKDNPKVRWKDSINLVLSKHRQPYEDGK